MRVLKYSLISLLIFQFVFFGAPTSGSSLDSLLRLHVKANSDAPADQALKYQVRDTVIAILHQYLQNTGSAEAAQAEVAHILPEVLAAAQTTVNAAGFDYQVTASLGPATFPTRMYGDQVYRAGTYQALQIYLGEGQGQNWWCVLFPPLCFAETRSQSDSETVTVATVPKKVETTPKPKSRILEWFGRFFGKK